MKAPFIVNEAKEALESGNSVVIGLQTTGEVQLLVEKMYDCMLYPVLGYIYSAAQTEYTCTDKHWEPSFNICFTFALRLEYRLCFEYRVFVALIYISFLNKANSIPNSY